MSQDDDMVCPWDYGPSIDFIEEDDEDFDEEDDESSWSEENLPQDLQIANSLQRPGQNLR